ncbi:MAG: methionine--tRNA ligase subunit beta [Candidatus Hodarchaeota archaeon]
MIITIDEFKKMDLRIGKISSAERVKGSKNLIRMEVDVGEEKPRQLVAGLASFYEPEELIEKHIVVLINLKPAKIFGLVSHGMLLAAVDAGKVSIISPDQTVSLGSRVE